MTPTERLDMLVRLAMEAWDRGGYVTSSRYTFESYMRERMTQAAQVWTNEVAIAEEVQRCPHDRLGCHVATCERYAMELQPIPIPEFRAPPIPYDPEVAKQIGDLLERVRTYPISAFEPDREPTEAELESAMEDGVEGCTCDPVDDDAPDCPVCRERFGV